MTCPSLMTAYDHYVRVGFETSLHPSKSLRPGDFERTPNVNEAGCVRQENVDFGTRPFPLATCCAD